MTRDPFSYAVLRVVPQADRGESINVGVILFCQPQDILVARTHLDPGRLAALDPSADPQSIEEALRSYHGISAGDPGAGPAASGPAGRRFSWLTAPRSTVVRSGPVHTGLTTDALAETDHLLRRLVLVPSEQAT